MAVQYVVLPDARLDYSSHAEAALLRGGAAGLPVVLRTRHVTIFAVPHPRPMVTGSAPGRVLSLGQAGAVIDLPRAGSYRVAIRYTPYWRASAGCIRRTRDGMTRLTVPHAGVVRLSFRWSLHRALHVLDGSLSSNCSARSGVRRHGLALG
jgi:hypothetical protein